ncbi:AMP-binding protein [Pseudomonas sp. N040]|uniref:AMP-binding protein n=1 Tax=Pseudomonas sp. N040 TaxID=2785325 RepID=UPI0018A3366B|nr:AMP-binding protein [Pseudomonas sp. N040]MBF7731381.1 AMP-binding protein [Pseudomonas sp. N040]MBW7015024.1 AMP-binding protein [Pseudomonas sp. N040]
MTRHAPLTLAGVIQQQAETRPDFTVLTVEGAGVRPDDTRTFAQLWEQGQRLASGLHQLGLRPGDKLGTLLANHAEFVELMVAAALLDLTLVPIDPRTKGDKLVYMLASVGCKAVVAGDYALNEVIAVRPQIASLQWLIGLPTDEGKATVEQLRAINAIPYAELAAGPARPELLPGASPDSALELIYTSGTTGDPKGIVMTHRRYVETARSLPAFFGFQADDRLYSGLSLTHANAQLITLGTALVNAIPCVLSRRFSKSRLWDITRQYGCTNFTLLGGMTTAIYAEPPKADDADNPVRSIISAGMPAAIWEDFARRFDVRLYEFYGAAEGGLTGNPPGVGPVGSIGKPVASLDYRLVDEAGEDVPRDAHGERVGELLFRPKDGTPFKVEYYGNPEASAKKCAGGWLRMGDEVREDRDGWLYFLCRKGSGIRRNGDFINSAFIEKVIAEQPEIDDVYVYGIPSANGVPGEKDVVAAVVPRQGGQFDVQALYRICRARLEANFVPSHIQVLQQIPKTASEKPLERFLVEALTSNPEEVHRELR